MVSISAFSASTTGQVQNKIPSKISVKEAYQLSLENKIQLIDIRRPGEWRSTGVARTATPITMHQNFKTFLSQLRRTTKAGSGAPVALICARGHRSRYMQKMLKKAGYTNIVDVTEGMLGSRRGPGWLKTGLPTKKWSSASTQ
jgi:rhodanese-related sulfurtransferase